MFSKKSQLALALVCVLGTGALLTGTQEPQAADAPAAAKAAAPAVEVTVITTKASDVAMESTLSGRTNAYRVAEVRPQVSGILMKRLFEEGAEVKKVSPSIRLTTPPTRPRSKRPRRSSRRRRPRSFRPVPTPSVRRNL